MRKLVLFCLAVVLFAGQASADDRVTLLQGTPSRGKLIESTPNEITIEIGQTKKKFAVKDIDTVTFDSEPGELAQARVALRAGRLQDANALLAKLDPEAVKRPEIKQDVEFYKALATARLALAGQGSKRDAGTKLLNFEKANPNSFHYYESCEALGDLLMALERYDQAESYYNKVGAAPWPEFKLRATVLAGRALLGQKKFDDSLGNFNEALAMDGGGRDADSLKLAATLGKAAVNAAQGKTQKAITEAEDVIAKADPENLELHARAYNVLGNAYRAAGKKKDAFYAFLHVDLLYSRFGDLHAEALANMAALGGEIDKPDRAQQARDMLHSKYPDSSWAAR